jgi:acyl carrier protein
MPHLSTAIQPLTLATSDQDPVLQKICNLLTPFNRHDIIMRTDTNIITDLEVDSVAIFDLVMEVEDAYEIAFPMEMISEMKTIGDLVSTIHNMKAG